MGINIGKSSLLIKKGSVFDLAAVYLMLYLHRRPSGSEYSKISVELVTLLDDGFTFDSIINSMLNLFVQKRTINSPIELRQFIKEPKTNLLKFGIYYHKELRIQPAPSTTTIDYNTGTMVSSGQEYFVEMAASYTLDDLVKYMLSFGYVNTTEYPINRIKGLLKYYVGKYSLDTVLFMMEAVGNTIERKEDFSFDKFDNYYSIATEYLNNIKNNCHSTGGNVIIPRKRNLF